MGLGNPGETYRDTRHNVGYMVLDEVARRMSTTFQHEKRWNCMLARSGATWLLKPLTFMNLSGEAVGGLLRYFKIDVPDLLVVVDEVHLPLGKLRARANGSAGGHNGLKSIAQHIGDDFARLRLGVGRGDSRRDLSDHVLSRFEKDEAAEVERMIWRAADAADTFIISGIAGVMNQYNGGDPATTE